MRLTPLVLLLCLVLAACGDGAPSAADAPVVVTTTTQVTDLTWHVMCPARQKPACAGPQGLLGSDQDPHGYELRPDDVARLADADLIVRSGGEVDEWLDEAIESSGTDAPVVTLLDAAGGGDPHWWTDPVAAQRAVEAIRDALDGTGGAGSYSANATLYLQRLERLDASIERCVERVAPEDRKVVTNHDALERFADRYGIEVIGTVIPSRSTQAQSSAGEVAELVRAIRRSGVTAVFSEAAVNRDVGRAIAEEAGVRVGEPLHVDSLGDLGYLAATARNAEALVDGMSGGKVRCLPGS